MSNVGRLPLPPLPLDAAGVVPLAGALALPAGAGPDGPQVVQNTPWPPFWLLELPDDPPLLLPPPPPRPALLTTAAAPGTELMTAEAAEYSAGRASGGT